MEAKEYAAGSNHRHETTKAFRPTPEMQFTIKHLADFSGIKSHTIRTWEKRFTFLRAARTKTSRRTYTVSQVNYFLQVCLLKQHGYRMHHIAEMSAEEIGDIIAGAEQVEEPARTIHLLIDSMISMDSLRFNSLLNDYAEKWGIHDTIQSVILPFSERIGLFDSLEKKSYRHHIFLVLEAIKQKLYSGIESLSPHAQAAVNKSALLFLSGSSGELPLLYLHYLIKKEGYTTIYLGQHFSVQELDMICYKKKPDFIVTWLPAGSNAEKLRKLLTFVNEHLPETGFISAGEVWTVEKNFKNFRHATEWGKVAELLHAAALKGSQ